MQVAEPESGILESLDQFIAENLPSPVLQALAIVVVSLVVAKLTDLLLCGIILGVCRVSLGFLDVDKAERVRDEN